MTPYIPRPGSIAEKGLAYLLEHGATRTSDLASALGVDSSNLAGNLQTAVRHGVIHWRRHDGGSTYFPGPDPESAQAQEEAAASAFGASCWMDGEVIVFGATLRDDGSMLLSADQAVRLAEFLGRCVRVDS